MSDPSESSPPAWTRAPQHRRNLYDPRVRRAGIAASQVYVTLFACE